MCIRAQSVDTVATSMINTTPFTMPVVKFIKHEVEKSPLEKAKMGELFKKLSKTVEEKDTNVKDGITTKIGIGTIPKAPDGHIRQQENQPEDEQYINVFQRV